MRCFWCVHPFHPVTEVLTNRTFKCDVASIASSIIPVATQDTMNNQPSLPSRVRSTREGNVLTHVCLSVCQHGGRGVPSSCPEKGLPPSSPNGGIPHPVLRWGTPQPEMGVTPPPSGTGLGVACTGYAVGSTSLAVSRRMMGEPVPPVQR